MKSNVNSQAVLVVGQGCKACLARMRPRKQALHSRITINCTRLQNIPLPSIFKKFLG